MPAQSRATLWSVTMAWPRRLIPLLLMALSACAAPGLPPIGALPATPVVKPPPLDLTASTAIGPACIPQQSAIVQEALGIARGRVAAAIAFLERAPQHPHVQRWFGTAPPAEVMKRYRLIEAWMARPITVGIECNSPQLCRSESSMGYASGSRAVIGVCPRFFEAGAQGFDTNWGVLIHEISHLAAATRDHVYGPRAAAMLAREDPARAAENADNYEYFVETLPES
jgi:hypothetical protein